MIRSIENVDDELRALRRKAETTANRDAIDRLLEERFTLQQQDKKAGPPDPTWEERTNS